VFFFQFIQHGQGDRGCGELIQLCFFAQFIQHGQGFFIEGVEDVE